MEVVLYGKECSSIIYSSTGFEKRNMVVNGTVSDKSAPKMVWKQHKQ